MANVRVDLDHPILDGESVTFKAPCDCTAVTGLIVYYPSVNEEATTTVSKTFVFKDAHGNNLAGIGNLFMIGAYVKVVLDTTNNCAYIQNADTNAYIEGQLDNKVSKSGDTMTGTLAVDGGTTLKSFTAKRTVSNIQGNAAFFVANLGSLGPVAQVMLTLDGVQTSHLQLRSDGVYFANVVEGTGYLPLLNASNLASQGVSKVQTGSYVGTGVNTSAQTPMSLTFDFEPKLVIVNSDYATGGSVEQNALIMIYQSGKANPIPGSSNHVMNVTWGENSVSWYSAADSSVTGAAHYNSSGYTYHWVAIG